MIAIDTSAIVSILLDEAEAGAFRRLVSLAKVVMGTPTLCETAMVLESRLGGAATSALKTFVGEGAIEIVPFTLIQADTAHAAFKLYGKGRGHPAQLNFGDCLSYAVAKTHALPLLFKGDDFFHTDLVPAYDPAL